MSELTGMGYAMYNFYLFFLPVNDDGVSSIYLIKIWFQIFFFARGDKSHNKLSRW